MSVRAMLAVALLMWDWGHRGAAVVTCLAYDRVLRTTEFLTLTPVQLTVCADPLLVHVQLPCHVQWRMTVEGCLLACCWGSLGP